MNHMARAKNIVRLHDELENAVKKDLTVVQLNDHKIIKTGWKHKSQRKE